MMNKYVEYDDWWWMMNNQIWAIKKLEQKSEKFKLNIMQPSHDKYKWNEMKWNEMIWYVLEKPIQYTKQKGKKVWILHAYVMQLWFH